MVLLPIADRELRVASRKPGTFRLRIAAALAALIIGVAFFTLATFGTFGMGPSSYGKGLFATLTWLSLISMLSAGLFFTSDCLSEEKREGTIGFLFLTDLRGYDVVLGKLLATSLRAFYALLAVFPILAVTLMMGGVTGTEFWKTALALVNALAVSLAAGLFISAVSRDSQKALAGTLLLILLLTVGGPIIDGTMAAAGLTGGAFQPMLSLASPGYVFVSGSAWGKSAYWLALLINQLIACTLLGLSCVLLPRTWQEKERAPAVWAPRRDRARSSRATICRQELLGANPVLWLATRGRWQTVAFWGVSILATGSVVAMLAYGGRQMGWLIWSYFGALVTLALYLVITSQACRFFVDVQRSGLIELLLATPLTVKQIVQGQWRALLRMFGGALCLYLVAQLIAAFMVQAQWAQMARTPPATPAPAPPPATAPTPETPATNNTALLSVTNVTTTGSTTTVSTVTIGPSILDSSLGAGAAFLQTLTIVGNLAALAWFGMWMGLTSRNSSVATLKTIAFVQVIPWFVMTFASALLVPLLLLPMLSGRTGGGGFSIASYKLLSSVLPALFSLGKDAGFILWSRNKLYTDFRDRATRWNAPTPQIVLPPPLPP